MTVDSTTSPGSTGIKNVAGRATVVFEKSSKLRSDEGDGITIGANGAVVTAKWRDGTFHDFLRPFEYKITKSKVYDYTGHYCGEVDVPELSRGYTVNRGIVISAMYNYAQELGILIFMDSAVSDFWETDSEAGIVVNHGERVAGDCVVCAEGIHSLGRSIITGQQLELEQTGFAASRGYLNAAAASQIPDLSRIMEDKETGDRIYGWVGPRFHTSIWTKKRDNELFWYSCHEAASANIYNNHDMVTHILECIKEWPARSELEPLIRKVGDRRMIVIGDAAHPVLPISGQGGTQAIEDAAVLAIALELAGKAEINLALEATEKIRYQRARTIQQGGLAALRFLTDHVDFDAIRENLSMLKPPLPTWILDHDCQEYTYREFLGVAEAIRTGKQYIPTNIPTEGIQKMENQSQ
ncbi:FAD/NAD(P)-binding domain-containing protein [Aspergillus spinulosporus]